jgi:phenylacetate-CoA ligase
MSRLGDLLVGNVSFPLSNYLMNRRDILTHCRRLRKSEWFPESALREMQFERLKRVVKHSAIYNPYYKGIFKRIGLEPGDIKCLEDLRLIPPLSRQEVIDHHQGMVDVRLQASVPFAERSKRPSGEPIPFGRFRKHKLVRNTSSGSTGAPTVFFEDGSRTALNWAYERRLKDWFGIAPGAKEARMVRLTTMYDPGSRTLALRRSLWHQMILPGMNLAEQHYAFSAEWIRRYRPTVLFGITSALTGLADHLQRNGVSLATPSLRLVVTWAAPLYEHEKKRIEEAFGCPVTNIYGSREIGHIAALCPRGSYHINQENLIVESEKVGVGPEDTEELIVTHLDISPMPFLRFRMGDVGATVSSTCACGRTLQVLTGILGRTGEVFIAKDGRMISPNFWGRVFMSDQHPGHISRFQVVYTKDKNLRIRIVKGAGYSAGTEKYIRGIVRENFSADTKLDFEYLEEIRPQVSGKYQLVVNEGNR